MQLLANVDTNDHEVFYLMSNRHKIHVFLNHYNHDCQCGHGHDHDRDRDCPG